MIFRVQSVMQPTTEKNIILNLYEWFQILLTRNCQTPDHPF